MESSMTRFREIDATPDAPNAIRLDFSEDEPPAVVFNEQAPPGALVSWSWCQLKALDDLLVALAMKRSSHDGDGDIAGAVRTVLVPVIKALAYSECRAGALHRSSTAIAGRRGRSRTAGEKQRAKT
jgi:hypothetical protein